MSSEEKEPYFDGPLVTPSVGQIPLYPGQNHVMVGGNNHPVHNPHPVPNPGPAFYNPNEFVNNVQPYQWNPLPAVAHEPVHSSINGQNADDGNLELQGAQTYFGGVESSSSAASSQQTSPQHENHQKAAAAIGHTSNHRHIELSQEGAVGLGKVDSPVVQNEFSAPAMPVPNDMAGYHGETEQQMQPSTSYPAATSYSQDGQLQNYMNSRSNQSLQLHNDEEEAGSLELPEQPFNSGVEHMGHALNTIELHNTSQPAGALGGNDESYMNMAYTHNYSGAAASTLENVGDYAGSGLQVHSQAMLVPSTSSQDYDILHSQGTWDTYGHNLLQYNIPSSSAEVTSGKGRNSEGLDADLGSMHIDGGNLAASAATPILRNVTGIEDGCSAEENRENISEETPPPGPNISMQGGADAAANSNELLFQKGAESLAHGFQQEKNTSGLDVVYAQGSGLDQPEQLLPKESLDPSVVNKTESASASQNTGQRTIPTDKDVPATTLEYSPGASQAPTMSSVQQVQSQNREVESTTAGVGLDSSNFAAGTQSEEGSGTASSVDFDTVKEQQSADLPKPPSSSGLPESTLHPQALNQESHPTEPDRNPSFFASPTSAFESRIRSTSTSSNNSTNSSHKSAGSQSKNFHARPLQSLPQAAHNEDNELETDVRPFAQVNPFSTNTMHSSHMDHPTMFPTPQVAPGANERSLPEESKAFAAHSAADQSQSENLRTYRTLPNNNPQSLHSQVLPHGVVYAPPREPIDMTVRGIEGSPNSDSRRAEATAVGAVQQQAPESKQNTLNLKHQEGSDDQTKMNEVNSPPNPGNDPYLSRSAATASGDPLAPPSMGRPQQHDSPRRSSSDWRKDQSSDLPDRVHGREWPAGPDSRSSHSAVETRDQPWHSDDRRYQQERSPRRVPSRPQPPIDYQNRDDFHAAAQTYDDRELAHQAYQGRSDEQHSRKRDWDYHEEQHRRYDSHRPGSRQDQNARSMPIQDDSSPRYQRPYDRDYRDPYYDQRGRGPQYYDDSYYQDYGRGDPYYDRYGHRGYDPRYDQYQKYHGEWPDRSRKYYDNYYYDGYYQEQRNYGSRRPDDEDALSVYSERSHVDQAADRNWDQRRRSYAEPNSYGYDYGYGYGYDTRYYDEDSTLSNTYDDSWQRLPQAPARQTPVKFATTHTVVRFGPGGQLIKVVSNRAADNQPSTVEIHAMEILLQETSEAEDLRSYAGPLSKDQTHKNDVLQFCVARSVESMKDTALLDRRSTSLIWDFLALLVRQNGSVHGTDIAELLTKDLTGEFGFLQSPLEAARLQLQQQQHRVSTPNSISEDHTGTSTPITGQADVAVTLMEKNCNRFRELLLHGRKKDALEWAMKTGLWGHALLLASKTDSRTHAQVMLRFANSLPINDPLQTVYQLMSGRQPAAATCVSEEGWGDWRPHLAMILSNPTSSASLDMRAVLTMGDTLSSRGLLHAAHFCYLMSSTPLGYYGRATSKMVLLGSSHTLPFAEFATWDSIRRTEIYEYAISLGNSQRPNSGGGGQTSLPPLQVYKFIYACKLAEYGLTSQAFHYCERVARAVCRSPPYYSPTLVSQLLGMADRLRHHDPQIRVGIAEPGGLRWLEALRNTNAQIQSGIIVPRCHDPQSLLATSNASSVVSTGSTSASPNDEIQFTAHTPDQEESEDCLDGGPPRRSGFERDHYNGGVPGSSMPPYSASSGYEPSLQSMTVPDTSHQQPPLSYGQAMHGGQPEGMQSQNYHQQYVQPQPSYQQQPAAQSQNFSSLATMANPLGTPEFAAPSVQQQSSYGFDYNQQNQGTPDEEAERGDQVDYYDYMSSTQRKPHHTHASSRSRTVSQSSQRSRASTLKGYDRTTPTSMVSSVSEQGRRSRKTSENSTGKRSRRTSGERSHHHDGTKPKEEKEMGVKKSDSWSIFGWFARRQSKQVHLPDDKDKQIVWDNENKRWVDKNATEEESAPPPPPPKDDFGAATGMGMVPSQQPHHHQGGVPQMQGGVPQTHTQPLEATPEDAETSFILPHPPSSLNSGVADGNAPPTLTANRFSLKNLGGNRSMYKNAFESSSKPMAAASPSLLPGMQVSPANPSGFLVPNAAAATADPANADTAPAATSTPMHQAPDTQAIQMFTPGNTPHGSASDFHQPFNHEGPTLSAPQMAPPETTGAAPPPMPTMFYNPSQFGAGANILSQPSVTVPAARGVRGRGRYPVR